MSKKKDTPRPLPDTLGLPPTGADSHAHLDSEGLLERLPEVMERARNAGLATIGQVFLSPSAYYEHRDAFAAHPGVFFMLGIHPCDGQECTGAVLKAMRDAFAGDDRLRAVGEIGLDFFWEDCPHFIQEEAFRVQLALAKERDLPVVIHSRDAARDSLRVLEAEGFAGRPVLWHCFSGDAVEHLDRFLANGWHISIPGPVTYPANHDLREAVKRIPADRLMIETDCPYLSPVPWRGKPNETAFAAFTAEAVARERGEDPAELWTRCGDTTRRFFGVTPPGLKTTL
ncbi:TatD family hydrolase [uncultured Bilophila sp.]|uniref:TatD family hydrolase n=1 Tax=uncultured Bilophila sp. TaxID=529385 RepID=UPI0026DB6036|nr:TatD family hydrolase [uncultured Bilophila sp.]